MFLEYLGKKLDINPKYIQLYNKLKSNKTIEYYLLGPQNKNWYETFRNPFFGTKRLLGVKNINPTAWIDIRIWYKPYHPSMGTTGKYTLGEPWIRIPWRDMVLFEIRKPHPPCCIYYNGFITFQVILTKKIFPYVSFVFRPCHQKYFTASFGFEGTCENDKEIAELGGSFRIVNFYTQLAWNPQCISNLWNEGHI